MSHVVDRVVLGVSALVLVAIGVSATFATAAFYASYDILTTGSPELASELRGLGLALLLLGLAIAVAVLRVRWVFPAAVVTAAVMLGLALGRAGSAIVDGLPATSMMFAGLIELVLGLAAVWVAVRHRPRRS